MCCESVVRDFPVATAVFFFFNIEGVGALIVRNTTAMGAAVGASN
jgi:hypothetical protein